MSFAPKKKLGPGSTARGKSINKNDSQLCINKSFENTRLVFTLVTHYSLGNGTEIDVISLHSLARSME